MSSESAAPPHPDSRRRPGVPRGDLIRTEFSASTVFPGTTREVVVYVPKQHDGTTPACVYVNQDGLLWRAPTVFDNLIESGELPVLVGVFVSPGVVKAADGDFQQDMFNRSQEYDGLGDNYATFLLDELLPFVETLTTLDGRRVVLSKQGKDRAIGGLSSGAACAFNAAWERPDAFQRVFSSIGSYVALRGGHAWSTLIRKTEPKPISIFLEDGSNDLNNYAGDWWIANLAMESALKFSGYELETKFGTGSHDPVAGTAIFPDAMRWLWKGWPEPVAKGTSKNETLAAVFVPGHGWEIGTDSEKVDSATLVREAKTHFGVCYSTSEGKIWATSTDGNKAIAASDAPSPAGALCLSPDQSRLYVADPLSHRVINYHVSADGSLGFRQTFHHLHFHDTFGCRTRDIAVDTGGRSYVATALGIQLCDQLGRVNAIVPLPRGKMVERVAFVGDEESWLWAQEEGGQWWKRKVTVQGARWDKPVKPPIPRL